MLGENGLQPPTGWENHDAATAADVIVVPQLSTGNKSPEAANRFRRRRALLTSNSPQPFQGPPPRNQADPKVYARTLTSHMHGRSPLNCWYVRSILLQRLPTRVSQAPRKFEAQPCGGRFSVLRNIV